MSVIKDLNDIIDAYFKPVKQYNRQRLKETKTNSKMNIQIKNELEECDEIKEIIKNVIDINYKDVLKKKLTPRQEIVLEQSVKQIIEKTYERMVKEREDDILDLINKKISKKDFYDKVLSNTLISNKVIIKKAKNKIKKLLKFAEKNKKYIIKSYLNKDKENKIIYLLACYITEIHIIYVPLINESFKNIKSFMKNKILKGGGNKSFMRNKILKGGGNNSYCKHINISKLIKELTKRLNTVIDNYVKDLLQDQKKYKKKIKKLNKIKPDKLKKKDMVELKKISLKIADYEEEMSKLIKFKVKNAKEIKNIKNHISLLL